MKLRMLYILGMVLLAATLLFIFQNLETVTISFMAYSATGPVSLAIGISFFAGFFVGLFFMWPTITSRRKRIKVLEKEHQILKKKLDSCAIEYRTEGLGTEGEITL